MIISFSITNFRSIKNKLTLSMLPAKGYKELSGNIISVNEKIDILCSAVIYGANASGKSNLLKALINFINFIKTSSSKKINEDIEIYDPFLLDRDTSNAPAEFEMEFLINKIKYYYFVSYDKKNIINEKLIYYPKGQPVFIFERKNTTDFEYNNRILKGEKKSIENRLLNNQLYISKAANEKLNILDDVYKYFNRFNINDSDFNSFTKLLSPGTFIGTVLKAQEPEYFKRFEKIILALDLGIHSLKLVKNTNDTSILSMFPNKYSDYLDAGLFPKFFPNLNYELFAVHKVYNKNSKKTELIDFPLERESAGTKNLFTVALNILESFKKGAVMIVDEFEKNLHPHIVKRLIKLFHDPEINTNNAQLIFTTHAINLLDNDLFRRDQIWFTDKNEHGETDLYSLSEFKGIRKDMPLDKWYLNGRFGATPILSDPDIKF